MRRLRDLWVLSEAPGEGGRAEVQGLQTGASLSGDSVSPSEQVVYVHHLRTYTPFWKGGHSSSLVHFALILPLVKWW